MPTGGHISSIGAVMFSDISVCREAFVSTPATEADWKVIFGTELAASAAATASAGEFTRIKNVREFPSMGTPPNIVNVPVYGQSTSQQIQGQSDAPQIELKLNFVSSEWAKTGTDCLADMVGDGKLHAFRFTLLASNPAGYSSAAGAAGLGSVQNSQFFWIGKLEALLIDPQLTDAAQATLTISLQSAFYGAYTTIGA